MRKRQRQERTELENLGKAVKVSSVILNILLFIGGVMLAALFIWLFVCIGTWIKIGI